MIIFIDDDFIVGDDYFANMESIFEQDDSIVGLSGNVVADGANSSGFTFEQGLRLAEQYVKARTLVGPRNGLHIWLQHGVSNRCYRLIAVR